MHDPAAVRRAVEASRHALATWRERALDERVAIARAYAGLLKDREALLARMIARETGKPLWEAMQEVGSMIGKVELSIAAQAERAGERITTTAFGSAHLRHRSHGVMAVLGPYNFPGHLPNGHIVPALIAGNTVVFKPSEETPGTGAVMADLWGLAGLPQNVLSVVQGGRATGEALVAADIDGLLFTGSAATGAALRRALVDRPNVIAALELGGNNPLVIWDADPAAAATHIVASAFVTTGQRCSCARRLIVPASSAGDDVIEAARSFAARLRVGNWNDDPEPFCGPLVSEAAAAGVRRAVADLIAAGARTILDGGRSSDRRSTFVDPTILDVTGLDVADREIFGPVLQVVRVGDFEQAIDVANATAFGLAAGLVSDDAALWSRFSGRSRAGVVNWNRPTTGASGGMPFGGLGASGNHRPSAYYAADYCAYPMASFEAAGVADMSGEIRGLAPLGGDER